MPINNITQTMSTISPPPHRGVDVQTVFVNKQEDFQDHLADITIDELNTLKDQLNTRIGEINSTATTMNGYADTASAGASTATTKAGEASTSASEALTSRNQASTFATNSSNSAIKASQWADNNYNVEVETGKYSAKHWSTVAQNATADKVDKVTSTDNAIVRFDGTTGIVQNSGVTIDDNGNVGSGTQTFNGFGGSGFKNYIINGNFDIWQRGLSQTIVGYGSADRWSVGYISNATISRVAAVSGYGSYAMSLTTSNAVNNCTISQVIESYTCNIMKGKIVTLSFYCSSSAVQPTNSLSYSITKNATPDTSTLGSFSVIAGSFKSITPTTTPTKYSVSVVIPNDGTANSISVNFSTTNSSSGSSVYIYNVQLEKGSVATPFENLSYALQYEQCRRYYRRYATQQNVNDLAYKMRTTPTESGTAPYTYSAEM